ncbi:MAG TPA: NirD/YgiW/YdeI family stress tolerance protein [Acinetobacter parvus]|uniref:NirD/YgiW/YdeI family stress tolerance protein n=1 Tax=Acinetobacter parvus TaxID=134533 RepID=UPI002B710146|nr:NirD/YgiW/YdeI family stress tolerance protein [Acinetobacter parvus]HRM15283.1 NirD/YgiW/YdeI family stress tolerance protein [Acinetobacter parvus]
MNVFSKVAVIAGLVGATTFAVANTTAVNQQALAPTQITTVKQALTLKNDTPVKLKGYVVKATGDEKYQFSDQTGSITVNIDDDLWQGQPVSAKTPVTLIGEIDIDYKPTKRVEVDVDQVKF